MPGIAAISASMIMGAERRIDVAAANVSNLSTPGYRAHRVFADFIDARTGLPIDREALARANPLGAMTETGNPLDFASDAGAVMALRSADGLTYSRSAQLHRDGDGRLVDAQGRALQGADGGDLVISSGAPVVVADGTVLVDGQPQGRIGLFDPNVMGVAALPELVSGGTIKQGAVVGSDVELGDEMLELNKATRMAEAGAKLFQIQDDLLARAASQLGSVGK